MHTGSTAGGSRRFFTFGREERGAALIGAVVALALIGAVMMFLTGLAAHLHRLDREKRAGANLEAVAEMVLERYVWALRRGPAPPTPLTVRYTVTTAGLFEINALTDEEAPAGDWLDRVETVAWREPVGSGHRVWVVVRSPRSKRAATLVRYASF